MGFGHLPSGENTAWANRTLRAESLDQSWEANSAHELPDFKGPLYGYVFHGAFPATILKMAAFMYIEHEHILCVVFFFWEAYEYSPK